MYTLWCNATTTTYLFVPSPLQCDDAPEFKVDLSLFRVKQRKPIGTQVMNTNSPLLDLSLNAREETYAQFFLKENLVLITILQS